MTIQDALQDMFHNLITIAPLSTVELYLHKLYPSYSETEIKNALNRACLDLQMNYDKENGVVSMYKGPEISLERQKPLFRAFRVAVELMDDTQQIMRVWFPFSYYVINNNKVYEIAYIPIASETANSIAVGERAVPESDREVVRRIAVVPYGAEPNCIKRVGFSRIARVNEDNEVEILQVREPEDAWADMPK